MMFWKVDQKNKTKNDNQEHDNYKNGKWDNFSGIFRKFQIYLQELSKF